MLEEKTKELGYKVGACLLPGFLSEPQAPPLQNGAARPRPRSLVEQQAPACASSFQGLAGPAGGCGGLGASRPLPPTVWASLGLGPGCRHLVAWQGLWARRGRRAGLLFPPPAVALASPECICGQRVLRCRPHTWRPHLAPRKWGAPQGSSRPRPLL